VGSGSVTEWPPVASVARRQGIWSAVPAETPITRDASSRSRDTVSLLAILDLITDDIYPENAVDIFILAVVFVAAPWLKVGLQKAASKGVLSLCSWSKASPQALGGYALRSGDTHCPSSISWRLRKRTIMAEPPMASDLAQQLKANTAFFNNLFNPSVGPLLKAQADLLSGIETTFPDWLRRRQDAVEDTQQFVERLRTSSNPLETLKTQQEWMARSFLRLAADTAAYLSITEQMMDRARTWVPPGLENTGNTTSKGAESAQDAQRAERAASAGVKTAEAQAAAAARTTARPVQITERAG
jgi:hypothetical protein